MEEHDDAWRRVPNVVLTGFMGTGKSTVGRILAMKLRYRFVDTDRMIQSRHGPIPEIFDTQGEAAFREMEQTVADELARQRGLVISTGGRLMLDPVNAEVLGTTGLVVCLTGEISEITQRLLRSSTRRPLLETDDPATRIAELFVERAEAYAQFPQLDTTGHTPEDLAVAIEERLADLIDQRSGGDRRRSSSDADGATGHT